MGQVGYSMGTFWDFQAILPEWHWYYGGGASIWSRYAVLVKVCYLINSLVEISLVHSQWIPVDVLQNFHAL